MPHRELTTSPWWTSKACYWLHKNWHCTFCWCDSYICTHRYLYQHGFHHTALKHIPPHADNICTAHMPSQTYLDTNMHTQAVLRQKNAHGAHAYTHIALGVCVCSCYGDRRHRHRQIDAHHYHCRGRHRGRRRRGRRRRGRRRRTSISISISISFSSSMVCRKPPKAYGKTCNEIDTQIDGRIYESISFAIHSHIHPSIRAPINKSSQSSSRPSIIHIQIQRTSNTCPCKRPKNTS